MGGQLYEWPEALAPCIKADKILLRITHLSNRLLTTKVRLYHKILATVGIKVHQSTARRALLQYRHQNKKLSFANCVWNPEPRTAGDKTGA
ncbi:hypothetical protein HAX54_012319, partial [Datura stramonium]|nr:hypothetical protein [Datura stramonium]